MAELELLDANLIGSVREFARWQEGAEVEEADGLLLVAGSSRFPAGYVNCAVRLDRRLAPSIVLERARDFFRRRRRGFTIIARGFCDQDLAACARAGGLSAASESPCMVISGPLEPAPLPAGIELVRVETERQTRDFVDVCAEAYESLGLPAGVTRRLFERADRVISSCTEAYLAVRNGRALAGGLVFLAGSVAGVYWIGTRAEARGLGLGEACTRVATNAGFAAGASMATLQASSMGLPIYRRLGYGEFDRLSWFIERFGGDRDAA